MNLTENYQLKKPVEPEKYDVQIFNTNADSIDQILKEHADKIDEQNEITNTNKEEVDNSISSLLSSVEEEISRAKTSETSIQNALQEEIERAAEAENTNRNDIAYEIGRATSTEESISNYISKNEPNWNDKYTKNEVDNKFSSLESNIDWKESVETYEDIAVAYPTPEDGWTVNVKDTDYTYRYSGTEWVVISANAIPKATNEVDGLLAKEDHEKYEDANSKKHTHENKSILDTITSSLIEKWNNAFSHISDTIKHITSTERTNWQTAYTHSQSSHAPSDAEKNIIVGVQKNGTDISVDSTTRKVNINVPTKVSELENDAGYKTTDTNYGVATSSEVGLVKPDNDMITVSADGTLKIPKIKMKNINTTVNLKEKFRTLMNDGTNASSFLTVIRNNASTDTTPIYGAGLGWGVHDTHTYLMGDYASKHIFAGAGSGDKLNWYDELAFLSSNVASATKATQDDEGNVIKDSYFMSKRGEIAVADINTFVSRKSGCYLVNLSGASDLLTVFAPLKGSASALEIYSNYPLGTLKVRGAIDNNRYTDWKDIAFTTSNVASATRLQSTRKINGTPFNGTNDITVPPNTTTLTNEDLNTLKTPGLYCAGGSNTCTNKPAGVDAFGMEVLKSASGWYTQVLYASNNQQKTYIRWFNSGSWTAWERYATKAEVDALSNTVGQANALLEGLF